MGFFSVDPVVGEGQEEAEDGQGVPQQEEETGNKTQGQSVLIMQ